MVANVHLLFYFWKMRRSSPDQFDLFGEGGNTGPTKPSSLAEGPSGAAWNGYFFAVVLPPDITQSVDVLGRQLRRSMGLRGKLIGPDRYHVSLCGIGAFGEAPSGIVDLLKRIGASVHEPGFDIFFDQTAAFSGSYGKRSLVLTASDTLPALIALQTRLHDAMQAANLPVDARFTPHITLLYDRRPASQIEIPRLSFTVRDFVLIRSVHGTGHHDHLARWPLRGGRLSAPA
ncbi:2'-5' RNA ligase family protein [Bosea vestrisii]|uniref:2'-5' RNA ligase family protein n=1 Tax=Bosea vestrisii TaxID=151416 RepID=UPI0024DF85DF|nr:2'-5' RNA ligase family protein [Bosea vestrisii]WID96707.1 2'-5' RNA ligase family protein [Bosea vestrisii]